MRIGSIFSGIGGIELGLERAGLGHTVFHSEIDPYCSRILEREWPRIPNVGDVRNVWSHAPACDLLCGGFPCQPTSQAAARSSRGEGWMWPEFFRAINVIEPEWVVIENPEALRFRDRGLHQILRDLASLGFDAEWRVLRASEIGAPHQRARLWVVAYANKNRQPVFSLDDEAQILSELEAPVPGWGALPDLRVDDGVPHRVDRLRALGNAVVPQCAEFVGRCILRATGEDA